MSIPTADKFPLFFVAGLPRSGSTLFCNILAQNENNYVTPTSPLSEVIHTGRRFLVESNECRSQNYEEMHRRFIDGLRNFTYGFFEQEFKSGRTVFDKSRGHPRLIEVWEEILNRRVKVLLTIRDLRDVAASLEKLYRADMFQRFPLENANMAAWNTVDGRADLYLNPAQMIGFALNQMRDLFHRNVNDRCMVVKYEELTQDPQKTMKSVYRFLELPEYLHDFTKIEQRTHEDDRELGILRLHTIRPEVKPQGGNWADWLPKAVGDNILRVHSWFYEAFYPSLLAK